MTDAPVLTSTDLNTIAGHVYGTTCECPYAASLLEHVLYLQRQLELAQTSFTTTDPTENTVTLASHPSLK